MKDTVAQGPLPLCSSCPTPPQWHLQHNMGSRLDLQDPRGPEGLKAGVRVVGEGGAVEGAGRLHMVQKEAELIWMLALYPRLWPPREDARGLTQHDGVVDHLARLWGRSE